MRVERENEDESGTEHGRGRNGRRSHFRRTPEGPSTRLRSRYEPVGRLGSRLFWIKEIIHGSKSTRKYRCVFVGLCLLYTFTDLQV